MEGRGYVARRKLASLRGELRADFSNVCNCEEETGRDYFTCTYMNNHVYRNTFQIHVQSCF